MQKNWSICGQILGQTTVGTDALARETKTIPIVFVTVGDPIASGFTTSLARPSGNSSGRLIDDVIQTDAALNPGNSGGPLVSSHGEVVGINTAVIMGAQGICFAVASNTANFVLGELVRHGRVRRAYIGVAAQQIRVPRRLRYAAEITQPSAVMIATIEAGSPAARGDLRAGDIILALDGVAVTGADDLIRLLAGEKIGRTVAVDVLRSGSRHAQALERVGLADRSHHWPNQLSGGEQQRVVIARAMVNDPALILADEPTGALDSSTSDEILSLFEDLHHDGRTIVVVTHAAEVADRAQRRITLHDGRIIEDDAVD